MIYSYCYRLDADIPVVDMPTKSCEIVSKPKNNKGDFSVKVNGEIFEFNRSYIDEIGFVTSVKGGGLVVSKAMYNKENPSDPLPNDCPEFFISFHDRKKSISKNFAAAWFTLRNYLNK